MWVRTPRRNRDGVCADVDGHGKDVAWDEIGIELWIVAQSG